MPGGTAVSCVMSCLALSSLNALSSSLGGSNLGVTFDCLLVFWCSANWSAAVLFCPTETFNQDQVVLFIHRSRKGPPCFHLLQTRLLHRTLFWSQWAKPPKAAADTKLCCRILTRHITPALHCSAVSARTGFKSAGSNIQTPACVCDLLIPSIAASDPPAGPTNGSWRVRIVWL